MKVRVWVVSTTIPERGEGPCMPAVFGSDVEAEAYADTMLRDEWNAAAIADGEADEAMPYPGAWREAQDRLIKFYGDGSRSRRTTSRSSTCPVTSRNWRHQSRHGRPTPAVERENGSIGSRRH